MRVHIVTVGKLKEKFIRQAADEYLKRLQPYAKVEVTEIAEEKVQEPVYEAEIAQIIHKEGNRILAKINPDTYLIALAIEGESLTSPQLAEKLHQLITYGQSHISFIIGGSFGLSKEVLNRANYHLSLSAMTFPHQLIRVFLLEQIYRACKINRGEVYHK